MASASGGTVLKWLQRTHTGSAKRKRSFSGLPGWSSGQELACQCRGCSFHPSSGRIPHAAGQLSACAVATEPCAQSPYFSFLFVLFVHLLCHAACRVALRSQQEAVHARALQTVKCYVKWECELIQPARRTVRILEYAFKIQRIKVPYDPAIPLLGINPEKTITEKDTYPSIPCSTVYNS